MALLIGLLQPAPGGDSRVDHLSACIDAGIIGDAAGEAFRPPAPALPETHRATVIAVAMEAPDAALVERVTLTVRRPGDELRLLLVDASAVFRGPDGADYAPVPNQRFILSGGQQSIAIEALPLRPKTTRPAPGTPLSVVWTNDPGVLAVQRAFQRLEVVEAPTLTRYLHETNGVFEVRASVKNRDVRLAQWMRWSRNAAEVIEGRYPRDALRFSLFAVSAGWTIDEVVNWLRTARNMDLKPALAEGWEHTHRTEYLLERAGLNHRVFSPNHADFHFNRGVQAYLRGDLKAAAAAFVLAEQSLPGFVDAKYNEGVVHYRAGAYQDASTAFLVAGGMRGASASTHYNRGATKFRLGDKRGAARSFREALKLNPKDPEASKWLKIADPEGLTAPKKKKKKKKRRRRRRRK
jgi:TolA-binding protein